MADSAAIVVTVAAATSAASLTRAPWCLARALSGRAASRSRLNAAPSSPPPGRQRAKHQGMGQAPEARLGFRLTQREQWLAGTSPGQMQGASLLPQASPVHTCRHRQQERRLPSPLQGRQRAQLRREQAAVGVAIELRSGGAGRWVGAEGAGKHRKRALG